MAKATLFKFAILYHPKPTKEQNDRGESPKTEVLVTPDVVLASNMEQAQTLAGRRIPESHVDKLDDVQVLVGPF